MSTITMPTTPVFPSQLEIQPMALTSASTNPFTGSQQVLNWSSDYYEVSASYQPMTYSDFGAWSTFIKSLNGMANVFQFPSAVCAAFPNELTTDGTTPQTWRLKSNNSVKWTIKPGSVVFGLVIDVRQAF